MWQDEAEEHLPRIASTQVLHSTCLKIPAPVVLLTYDLLSIFSQVKLLKKNMLWALGITKHEQAFFPSEAWNKKTPSNYNNTFKNVLRSLGRQRNETRFLQGSLQCWRAAVRPFVLHSMKCILGSLWLWLQVSPSYPTSCHFKLCLPVKLFSPKKRRAMAACTHQGR